MYLETTHGNILSYDDSPCLHLWQAETGEQLATFPLQAREHFFVSKDGCWLVTQLMTDSGNGQQESLDVIYIGSTNRKEIYTRRYIDLLVSNGLDVWFNDDCSELWVDGEWADEFNCTDICMRCYELNPEGKDLQIKHELLEEVDWPEAALDTEANTKTFIAIKA